jgi:hypothetical protein
MHHQQLAVEILISSLIYIAVYCSGKFSSLLCYWISPHGVHSRENVYIYIWWVILGHVRLGRFVPPTLPLNKGPIVLV